MIMSLAHAAVDEATSANVFGAWSNLVVGEKPTGLVACYLLKAEGEVQIAVTILQLHMQGIGVEEIPSQVWSMLPYLATILVMVLISRDSSRVRQNAPACLGKIFHPAA